MSRHEEENSWREYSRLVLSELKRLDHDIKRLEEAQLEVLREITALKTQAAVWGSIAGLVMSSSIYLVGKLFP